MKNGKWLKRVIWATGGLCALCCLLPVIGLSAGFAGLGAAAFYLERISVGLLAITAGAIATMAVWKRNRSGCAAECGCETCNNARTRISRRSDSPERL